MAHKLAVIRVLVLSLLAISASCDSSNFDDVKKTVRGKKSIGGGLNVNADSKGVSVEAHADDGNPFFYWKCSGGLSIRGFHAGCSRVWKPLFYVCIAGGSLLAALLLSCCCCCCCAPCRKKTQLMVVNPRPGYDVPMMSA